ncbi:MAG: choice-of-anchor Q domain-containing protein [Bacteroidota bacterium]
MPRLARLAALAVASLLLVTPARAQEIIVSTTVDEFGENPADCGLREAVQAANTRADFGGCVWPGEAPTIRLEADRYRFFRPGDLEEDNVTADLDIRVPLTIAGSQMGETTINGRFDDRVIDVHGVDVTIQDVRIRHGRTFRDAGGLNGEHGGGIRARDATLTLTAVVFLENNAGDGAKGSPGGNGGHGGALYALNSSVTMTDVLLRDNRAGDGGREDEGDDDFTVSGDGGDGGAIYIVGDLTITDGTFRDNRAGDAGDSVDDNGDSSGGSGGNGGAIWAQGSVAITDVAFDTNRAGDGEDEAGGGNDGGGGGSGGDGGTFYVLGDLALTDVPIANSRTGRGGDGFSPSEGEFSGPGGDGGAIWQDGETFSFTRGLVQNNRTSGGGTGDVGGSGGGLFLRLTGDALLTEVEVLTNRTADGSDERWDEEGAGRGGSGGGARISASTLQIVRSSFLDNVTGSGGDADERPGRGGDGGGLAFTGGALTVQASTFARNTTGAGGDVLDFGDGRRGGDGGGLFASVGTDPKNQVVIESSTFSGNATGAGGVSESASDSEGRGGYGGGIAAYGPMEVRNSTVVSNTVVRVNDEAPPTLGGGVYSDESLTIENSIIVENRSDGAPEDCSSPLASASFLLSSSGTGCPDGPGAMAVAPGETFVTVLDALRNTGGPTLTHALLPSSLALDAGSCGLDTTDQRGFPRPVNAPSTPDAANGCDIGATETQEGFVVRSEDAPGPTEADGLALRLAPNPATAPASVELRAEPGEHVTVEVLDVRGRRVRLLHEGPVSSDGLAVEVGALPAGIYLVRAVSGSEVISARLTVLR